MTNKNIAKKVFTGIAAIALIAVMSVVFVACNADSYQSKLEKNEYTVASYEGDKLSDVTADYESLTELTEKIEWVVTGTKTVEADGESVTHKVAVVKFDSSETAKKFIEDNTPAEGAESKVVLDRQMGIVFIASDEEALKAVK
jgi:uncharacterized protein (DUF1330 family)